MPQTKRLVALGVLLGVLMIEWPGAQPFGSEIDIAASSGAMLSGTITSPGEKMEGVMVSARAAGSSLTTSVLTDARGEYYFPLLPKGRYKVWAQAVGYKAGRAEVVLKSRLSQRQDFTLKAMTHFEAQLSGDRWMAALAEDTPEDAKMKEVFRLACNGCHTQSLTLLTRFDEKGWRNIITTMSRMTAYGYGDPAIAAKRPPNPVMEHYQDRLAAWLAKMRGPGPSPMKFTPRSRPRGDATLAVVRTYDAPEPGYGLPLFNDGSDWSLGAVDFYDPAHHHTKLATLDFEGDLWVTDFFPATHRTVLKIDWKTGQATPFKVPGGKKGELATSHDIKTDAQGMIWFDLSIGAFGRIDPRTGKLDVFSPPEGLRRVGSWIDFDNKGGVWSNAGGGGAVRFDVQTGTWKEFTDPPPRTKTYGMAGDRDGNGWWSMFPVDLVIKGKAQTGTVEAFKVPQSLWTNKRASLFTEEERRLFAKMYGDFIPGGMFKGDGTPYVQGIRKMGGDFGRGAVWGPTWYGGNLIKIDIRTNQMTAYAYPLPDLEGYDAVVDKDGMVWVMFTNADMIGKFDPNTERWTTYDLPTRGTKSHGLWAVTVNGRTQIATAHLATGSAEKIEFRTKDELQAWRVAAQKMARSPR